MNTHRVIIFAFACALAGCSGVPAPESQALKTTAKTYATVQRGLSLSDIEQRLGPALRQEPDGAYYWETRYNAKNYVCLRVWLNANGKAQNIRITQERGIEVPGYHSSTSFTSEK